MGESMNFKDKLMAAMVKFVNLKAVIALKEGIICTLPLTVVGSIFLLLGSIPSQKINNAITGMLGEGWTEPLMQVYEGTFAIMGIVACIAIAYSYVKNEGYEGITAGILALVSFMITINSFVVTETGEKVAGVIPKAWVGGQGMIAGIIIGLLVGATYSLFLRKKITIKMPEGVPQGVANQFAALVPGAFIITCSMLVYIFFKLVMKTTFIEWIYSVLQMPLQGLTDSLPGVIVIAFAISFLWWFGVHGQSIVNGVVTSLLTANAISNTEILQKTGELTVEGGAHIVTQQFLDSFLLISGSGITFGIVIAMLFFAKSAQGKAIGKMAILPGIFNINEPIVFGFPVVMNPFMFIPFILVPVLSAILVYVAIATGFLPPFSGAMLPWSTPLIISGLIVAGWKGALLQIAILAISVVVYLPFFKKQDQMLYENEQASLAQESEMATTTLDA